MDLEIKDIDIFYSFDKVTCYERPTAVLLDSICSGYGSLLILLCKLVRSYRIVPPDEDAEKQVIRFIEKQFLVDYQRYDSKKEILSELIAATIEAGSPIIIPVNLKEIFYSNYYREQDKPHFFMVTGVCKEKGIYTILDNVQFEKEKGISQLDYHAFVVTEEMLEKANRAFARADDYHDVFTFVKSRQFDGEKKKEHLHRIFMQILELYLERKNYEFLEVSYLKQLYGYRLDRVSYKDEIFELRRKLNNVIKYKEVFVSEIVRSLNAIGWNDFEEAKLFEILNELKTVWTEWVDLKVLKVFRKNSEADFEVGSDILDCERRLYQQILVIYTKLQEFEGCDGTEGTCQDPERCKEEWEKMTENNRDHIIRVDDQKKIVFRFHTNRIYNSWFEDACPKIVLFRGKGRELPLYAKSAVRFDPEFLEDKFQAGIYVKLRGEMYFGAIDHEDLLVLDTVGTINRNVFEKFNPESEIYLEIKDNQIDFGKLAAQEKQKKVSTVIPELEADTDIELGLACKTWGNGKKLELIFSDYSVEFGEKEDKSGGAGVAL